jgi:hypothetical protein
MAPIRAFRTDPRLQLVFRRHQTRPNPQRLLRLRRGPHPRREVAPAARTKIARQELDHHPKSRRCSGRAWDDTDNVGVLPADVAIAEWIFLVFLALAIVHTRGRIRDDAIRKDARAAEKDLRQLKSATSPNRGRSHASERIASPRPEPSLGKIKHGSGDSRWPYAARRANASEYHQT